MVSADVRQMTMIDEKFFLIGKMRQSALASAHKQELQQTRESGPTVYDFAVNSNDQASELTLSQKNNLQCSSSRDRPELQSSSDTKNMENQ